MKRITVAIVGLALGIVGCASNNPNPVFNKKVDQVRVGMTKAQVRTELGKPDKRTGGRSGDAVETAEKVPPVVGSVPAGSRYEDWSYTREGTRYHVVFGPGKNMPGRWEVVGTHTEVADAN